MLCGPVGCTFLRGGAGCAAWLSVRGGGVREGGGVALSYSVGGIRGYAYGCLLYELPRP